MDKGTNAKKALEGRIVSLKLGYVGMILSQSLHSQQLTYPLGVKNRSQEDINNGKTVRENLKDELVSEYLSYM